jgi:carbon storage regulator
MLVITRRVGEEIVIGGQIRVRVAHLGGKRVQLALAAPNSVRIHRGEVHEQRREFEARQTTLARSIAVPISSTAGPCVHTPSC